MTVAIVRACEMECSGVLQLLSMATDWNTLLSCNSQSAELCLVLETRRKPDALVSKVYVL